MSAQSETASRILIGASSFADAAAALRLIERIIRELQPSLGGILVDETTPLAICELPNQRVISASGQVSLAPQRAQVNAMIEADARAFRKSLSHIAETAGASWTFERGIGDLLQKSLDIGTASDILVLAQRKTHPVRGKVVLLSSSTASESKVMDMSRLLAQNLSADHIVMAVDETDKRLDASGGTGPGHFRTLTDVLSRLARINAQAVILDLAQGPVRSIEELRQLVDVARCPVFVFGMSAISRTIEHKVQIPPAPDDKSHFNGE